MFLCLSMRPLTLQRLQVFCAVYEQNSITSAAQQLQLSQPTVSRHLRDFEAALGISLFVLDKGRLLATPQADAIYLESRFLQDGISRLENRIGSLREGAGSTLSIMSVGLISRWPLPQAVASLSSSLPRLTVTVDIGTSEQQLNLLRAGLIDVGVLAGDVLADDLALKPIGQGHMIALFPNTVSAPKGKTIGLEELVRRDAIALSPKGPIGRIVNRALLEQDLSLSSRIVGNSIAAVPFLAETLCRPAFIDSFTARDLDTGRFRLVPLEEELKFEVQTVVANLTGAAEIAAIEFSDHLARLLEK